VDLTWTPDQTQTPASGTADSLSATVDATSILSALQEQLGLKLESTRAPVDDVVVDHIEQPAPD
jgi:uncharacterized protein (TIGR03435 family)